MSLTVSLANNQKVSITLNPDGPITSPRWFLDGAPMDISLSNSDLTALFNPQGPQGTFVVRVEADAGTAVISDTITFIIGSPVATVLNPVAGPVHS